MAMSNKITQTSTQASFLHPKSPGYMYGLLLQHAIAFLTCRIVMAELGREPAIPAAQSVPLHPYAMEYRRDSKPPLGNHR